MNRSTFLKTLVGLVAAPAIAARVLAKPIQPIDISACTRFDETSYRTYMEKVWGPPHGSQNTINPEWEAAGKDGCWELGENWRWKYHPEEPEKVLPILFKRCKLGE